MGLSSHVVKSTVVGALGGLLFGFDTAVISGTTAQLTQQFALSRAALGITVSSALFGTLIGAILAGVPGQRYGRRDSLRGMAVLYIISAFGCAVAWNLPSLIVFRFIGGLGIGGWPVLGPLYIAELAPANWRGCLVGFFQVNVVVGILLAYVSNAIITAMHLAAWQWRARLGISGVPAILFLVAFLFIPRSPRWLLTQRPNDEAMHVLRLIGDDRQRECHEIVRALREEVTGSQDSLLAKRYRLPVVLAITAGMVLQLTGINAVLYYFNDIFTLAGASALSSNVQAIAVGATHLVATLVAMSIIDRFGRKKLLLIGTAALLACLSGIGWIFSKHLNLLVWLLMVFIACFAISRGAVVWVYISEVFPTRLRARGQSLGSSSSWVSNAVISLIFPLLAGRSGAVPFFFFAACMVVDLVLVLLLPETARVALEDMQHAIGSDFQVQLRREAVR